MERQVVTSISTALMMLVGAPFFVGPTNGDPMDQEFFTNFESINTPSGVPFDIGNAPQRATFSGDAFSGIIGIQELYRSGAQAWMVNPGGTGTITFETNAAEVEFFARTRSIASGNTVITAFDDGGGMVGTPVTLQPGPQFQFQLVSFSGSIARIEVENFAQGALFSNANAIDDFGFTALAPLTGDYNGDGVVNPADYTVWRDTLGSDVDLQADGSGDGVVNQADYDAWKANFGISAAVGSSVTSISIPEPITLQLLLGLTAITMPLRYKQ